MRVQRKQRNTFITTGFAVGDESVAILVGEWVEFLAWCVRRSSHAAAGAWAILTPLQPSTLWRWTDA